MTATNTGAETSEREDLLNALGELMADFADREMLDKADAIGSAIAELERLQRENERQAHALRNCLLLANQKTHRAPEDSAWRHIIRFCGEGGIKSSPLREVRP